MPTTAPVQPINQDAVVDAALRAIYSVLACHKGVDLWFLAAQAIEKNKEAKKELQDLLECDGSDDDEDVHENDARNAFGLGMVAGMLYAASTGTTLSVPSLKEVKAALDLVES
jgi:hypothetical protein